MLINSFNLYAIFYLYKQSKTNRLINNSTYNLPTIALSITFYNKLGL